jgi:hypothetical protein
MAQRQDPDPLEAAIQAIEKQQRKAKEMAAEARRLAEEQRRENAEKAAKNEQADAG